MQKNMTKAFAETSNLNLLSEPFLEAAIRRCSSKKVLFKILQILLEKIFAPITF